jgi:hypothetical protein
MESGATPAAGHADRLGEVDLTANPAGILPGYPFI